jgi:hypothetical protein
VLFRQDVAAFKTEFTRQPNRLAASLMYVSLWTGRIKLMHKKLLLALTLAGCSFGQHHHDAPGKSITVVGQVVDTGCYLVHDSKGAAHISCAEACAKAGVPLAIVDEAGKVYLPIAADHKNQNAKLMAFIDKKVKITGSSVQKGGVNGIAIKTVEPAP